MTEEKKTNNDICIVLCVHRCLWMHVSFWIHVHRHSCMQYACISTHEQRHFLCTLVLSLTHLYWIQVQDLYYLNIRIIFIHLFIYSPKNDTKLSFFFHFIFIFLLLIIKKSLSHERYVTNNFFSPSPFIEIIIIIFFFVNLVVGSISHEFFYIYNNNIEIRKKNEYVRIQMRQKQ